MYNFYGYRGECTDFSQVQIPIFRSIFIGIVPLENSQVRAYGCFLFKG